MIDTERQRNQQNNYNKEKRGLASVCDVDDSVACCWFACCLPQQEEEEEEEEEQTTTTTAADAGRI